MKASTTADTRSAFRAGPARSESPWQVGEAGLLVLAALSLVLIRLPVLFGGQVGAMLVLAPFLGAIALLFPVRQRTSLPLVVSTVILVALIALELVRGTHDEVNSSMASATADIARYGVLVAFAYVFVRSATGEEQRDRRLCALALAPGLFAAANLLLHYAGFSPPSAASVALGGRAEMLGAVGIPASRVQFPLTNSINNFGVVAAAGFAASAVLALRMQNIRLRQLSGVVAASSLASLALSDSRAVLVIAVVVFVLGALGYVRHSPLVAWAIPVVPLLVVASIRILASSDTGATLSRSTGDVASGNGRLDIWRGAWETLREPSIEWLIGHGAGGQISSGASLSYGYVFNGQPDPMGTHTHNLAIQTMLDAGLLGLAALIITASLAFTALALRFGSTGSWPSVALIVALAVPLLSGATEVTPTYISREALIVALIVVGAAAGLPAWRADRRSAAGRRKVPATLGGHTSGGGPDGATSAPWPARQEADSSQAHPTHSGR